MYFESRSIFLLAIACTVAGSLMGQPVADSSELGPESVMRVYRFPEVLFYPGIRRLESDGSVVCPSIKKFQWPSEFLNLPNKRCNSGSRAIALGATGSELISVDGPADGACEHCVSPCQYFLASAGLRTVLPLASYGDVSIHFDPEQDFSIVEAETCTFWDVTRAERLWTKNVTDLFPRRSDFKVLASVDIDRGGNSILLVKERTAGEGESGLVRLDKVGRVKFEDRGSDAFHIDGGRYVIIGEGSASGKIEITIRDAHDDHVRSIKSLDLETSYERARIAAGRLENGFYVLLRKKVTTEESISHATNFGPWSVERKIKYFRFDSNGTLVGLTTLKGGRRSEALDGALVSPDGRQVMLEINGQQFLKYVLPADMDVGEN